MTKSYNPNFGRTTKPIPRCTTSKYSFIVESFIRFISCGVRSRNSKLQIVLKFLIFEQVVRPQFWSHDETNTQMHNFNIYSFIVYSFKFDSILPSSFGVRSRKRNPPEKLTDRRTDRRQTDGQTDRRTDPIVPRYRATRRAGD